MPIKIKNNQGTAKNVKFPIINNRLPSEVFIQNPFVYTKNSSVYWDYLQERDLSYNTDGIGWNSADINKIFFKFDSNLKRVSELTTQPIQSENQIQLYYGDDKQSAQKIQGIRYVYSTGFFTVYAYYNVKNNNLAYSIGNSLQSYLFDLTGGKQEIQKLTKYTLNYSGNTQVEYIIQPQDCSNTNPVCIDFGKHEGSNQSFHGAICSVYNVPLSASGVMSHGTSYATMYATTATTVDINGVSGKSTFEDHLTEIEFGDEVNKIGNYAYKNCINLISINIPAGPTGFIIGNNAFENSGLSGTLTIPSNVSRIDSSAFKGCTGITSVTGMMGPTGIANSLFEGGSNLTSFTIPSNIQWIGNSAFRGAGLTNINIPGTVKTIGPSGFANCTNMITATINDGVENIGQGAFRGCTAMTGITIPFVGESSSSNQFFGYIFGASNASTQGNNIPSSLKNITVSNGIIPSHAFWGCSNIEANDLNGSFGPIRSIGTEAFTGCSSITNLYLPYLLEAASRPFYGLYNVDSIRIGSDSNYFQGNNSELIYGLVDPLLDSGSAGVYQVYIYANSLGTSTLRLSTSMALPKLYTYEDSIFWLVLNSYNSKLNSYNIFNNSLMSSNVATLTEDAFTVARLYNNNNRNFKITLSPSNSKSPIIVGAQFLTNIWTAFNSIISNNPTGSFFELLRVGGEDGNNDWFEDIMFPGRVPSSHTYNSCWVYKDNNQYIYQQENVYDETGLPNQLIGEYNSAFLQYIYTISIRGDGYAIYDTQCSNITQFKNKYDSILP